MIYNVDNEKEEKKTTDSNYLSEQLIKSRTVLIFGEINQELAQKVTAQLLVLSSINDEPITVFINSQGGHVESGDTIHDVIRYIKCPVYMIGTGWVASAGTTIYLAAEKQYRLSLPNTRYLIHQPMGGAQGMASDIKIEAKEIIRTRSRINKMISDRTGQPLEKVEKDTDRNYWMSNDEAIAYGIVDRVVDSCNQLA